MHYLLFYKLAPGYLERREKYRSGHLKLAWESHKQGDLLLGGALKEPVDEAVLLFKGETPEAAERFAKEDPYVKNGLVTSWEVRPWLTVAGSDANSPVKP